jgi:hypothetical protein
MPAMLLYALAATLLGGGAWALDEANHQRAVDALKRRQKTESELLASTISLEQLRTEARAAGIDPEQVMAGYDDLRRGDITLEQMRRQLGLAA